MKITRFLKLVLTFIGPIFFGVIGFHYIEGWEILDSVYMTVITLTTIGFGEVHPLSPAGRIFTIILALIGIGNIAYIGTNLVHFLIELKLDEVLGRRKMSREIERLKGHTIICGYGRIGSQVAIDLSLSGESFVIIENNPTVLEKIKSKGYLYIQGSATDEEVLINAGLERARALISAVSSDAENVFITLTAKHLHPQVMVISRVFDHSSRAKLTHAGADKVISPFTHAGAVMARAVMNPNLEDFLEFPFDKNEFFQVAEFNVKKNQACLNKTLGELKLKEKGIIIVNIHKENGEKIFAPHRDTPLSEGDRIVAIGNKKDFGQVLQEMTT
jgi:voltage-gated potassium channel